jgi:hypothetical protein
VVLHDVELMVQAALDGVGIAFTLEEQVKSLSAPQSSALLVLKGLEPALGLEPRTC